MGPEIGEKRGRKLGGFGSSYFAILGCKNNRGAGPVLCKFPRFFAHFRPALVGKAAFIFRQKFISYFGKKAFHISAKSRFAFPQKSVPYFPKKAFHFSTKMHFVFLKKAPAVVAAFSRRFRPARPGRAFGPWWGPWWARGAPASWGVVLGG